MGTVEDIRTVGVVGWGRMGAEMGRWLVERGWPVLATDPAPGADERIRAAGAQFRGSAADVAREADLLLLVVVDDAQVEEAIAGPGGIRDVARPGTVVAICSSVRPDTCVRMAAAAAERDVAVVDVALVGGERAAEQGSLTLMCGGDAAVLDRCAQAFAAFATDVCQIGGPGTGQVAKSANNVLMWTALRADVEVLRLARSLGVPPGRLRSVLGAGTGANQVLADWGLHRLRWPAKDLEVALALAEEAGVDVPLVRALQPLVTELTREDLTDLR
ncbi:NAD(P)-dependent oxidoreductase [Blastococcus capsensis]|uniref:NAD(P)-dependent oxidoreductase n=1 Tax=Blastococcus capsensis TaxID=1564163 RepID=UPI0025417BF7|nr:NAD(P)-binding domain-containing protein [Blastococcus capsensis]MDK3255458.1 NAD(P)-binding domain-containing protein [Blastococcus capsensis]